MFTMFSFLFICAEIPMTSHSTRDTLNFANMDTSWIKRILMSDMRLCRTLIIILNCVISQIIVSVDVSMSVSVFHNLVSYNCGMMFEVISTHFFSCMQYCTPIYMMWQTKLTHKKHKTNIYVVVLRSLRICENIKQVDFCRIWWSLQSC
jgi:hypothetical protein